MIEPDGDPALVLSGRKYSPSSLHFWQAAKARVEVNFDAVNNTAARTNNDGDPDPRPRQRGVQHKGRGGGPGRRPAVSVQPAGGVGGWGAGARLPLVRLHPRAVPRAARPHTASTASEGPPCGLRFWPRAWHPTTMLTGRLFPNAVVRSRTDRRVYVTDEIEQCRDLSGIAFRRAFERVSWSDAGLKLTAQGMLTTWDAEKPVWDRIFSKEGLDVS